MAITTYYEEDASMDILQNKNIAIIGYGNQGCAQAKNLRDSGLQVIIGQREGKSFQKACKDGFEVVSPAEATARAHVVQILLPDETQAHVFKHEIEPYLKQDAAIMFSHGFNIHFGQIVAPQNNDVVMISPKSPGYMVRCTYEQGFGVPALIAVHQDATGNAQKIGLAYAKGIGCTRAGVISTSFREETETDLFGEQAVLCGGVSALVQAGFETLTEAGYAPELAYFECMHELKLIVDLMYEGGLTSMRQCISNTAEYGDYVSGPAIITQQTKEAMKKVLTDIQQGKFARDFILENQSGCALMTAKRRQQSEHPIELVGAKLRQMMNWKNK